jgi:hypothetical protein
MKIVAEFRLSIGTTIPEIVKLLKHSDKNIRLAGADTLSRLSGQGKAAKIPILVLLITIIAEFRRLIDPVIPEIAILLKDNHDFVRLTSADALS